MATYYTNSTNPSDVLPTSYLSSTQKPDPSYQNNIMYLNQDSLSPYYNVEIPSDENRGEMVLIPPTTEPIGTQQVGHILNGDEQNFQYQELSLSLGMQIPSPFNMSSFQYNNYTNSWPIGDQKDESSSLDTIRIEALNNQYPYCSFVNSKYLKATQQLLDELVNIREALKQPKLEKYHNLLSSDQESTKDAGEISADERKDLQRKMTKLSSMLDEVDRRYSQYSNQMQLVESSFEMVAGSGAAKSYTKLALRTISRHFRCLRDSICKQIQLTSTSLGEKDGDTLSNRLLPRLRYVDKKIRQQRTSLHHLGVVQHSWRPQRGLPENSVSILRAWLFEHFLHPYPKDSEKIMLARQTGLTRSQVANWFINARVRLWKPMVEDMYKEEFGADSEAECKSSPKQDASREAEPGDKSWVVDENIYYGMSNFNDDHKNFQNDIKSYNNNNLSELDSLEVDTHHNQVSLALGLHHSEKAVVGDERDEDVEASSVGPDHHIDLVNQYRFCNPHLLPDFVA